MKRTYVIKLTKSDRQDNLITIVNDDGAMWFNNQLMDCFNQELSDLPEDKMKEYLEMVTNGVDPQRAQIYVKLDYPDTEGLLGDGLIFSITDHLVVNSMLKGNFILNYELVLNYDTYTLKYGDKFIHLPTTGSSYCDWECDIEMDKLLS